MADAMKDTPATRGRRQSLPPAVMDTGGGGVMTISPPPQFLHAVRTSIEDFAKAVPLSPDQHGGLIGIATTKGVNLAIVQKIGGHGMIVGYVGKQWGEPIEGGVQWKAQW